MDTFTVSTITCYELSFDKMIRTALSNGDAGDTDSSQETFELFGSIRKKISGRTLMKIAS